MTNWDRASMQGRIFASWRQWREEGRFDGVLPGCGDQEWQREAARVGYRTVDYRTYRDLALPGAEAPVDLVELYWSVRTRDGKQDPDWPSALNVNIVAVAEREVTLADVEALYRDALAMRGALLFAGMGRLSGKRGGVSLYVRGVILGPSTDDHALLADALSGFADVPIAIALVTEGEGGALEVKRSAGAARFFDIASADIEALRESGVALIGADRLFRSEGAWTPDAP